MIELDACPRTCPGDPAAGDGADGPIVRIEPAQGWRLLDARELWEHRDLIHVFAARDVSVRYKQTVIGVAWMVLQPLLTLALFTVVFSVFVRIPSGKAPYPAFAFAALLPWSYLSQAVSRVGNSLVGGASLVGKVYFPRLVLPLASALTPLVDALPSFVVLLGMLAWYGIVPGARVVMVVPLSLLAAATALGVGLWLAALHVRYRDVGHLIPFLLQAWMYLCPVAYPIGLVPARWRTLYELNPMCTVIQGFRWALLGEAAPGLAATLVGIALVLASLVSSLVYFHITEETLVDDL